MIVVSAESPAELEAVANAINRARFLNRATADTFADVRFVFIGKQPSSTVLTTLATRGAARHPDLVSRHDTARRLGCSTSTVDRLARTGRLDKRDGKITATSIDHYLQGHDHHG